MGTGASCRARFRVGVDIGGTFTDFVAHDARAGRLTSAKLLTTPEDPSRAVLDGLAYLGAAHGVDPSAIEILVHATTLATNILIERNGAKVGLITTGGFRDLLEMRRETRYDDYDLALAFPPPLVPRRLRREVRERVLADGAIRVPLDEAGARSALEGLRAEGIEALAVSLLHAYANPRHEQRIGELAAERLPGLPVSLSHRVQPEIREYERTSTTVANAYVQPLVQRYLAGLTAGLAGLGYGGPFFVMLSNGGFARPEAAAACPVRLVESGPAAGAIAAAYYGELSGERDLIGFDMGGTTAKIAVVEGGQPRVGMELEVARVHRFKKGSGYPLRCPSVELIEIGAGGGSIASVDPLGLVRVGPRSAGARPGPACYGFGGKEPTVTDADLLLGYIDPDRFAGGRMRLERDLAVAAIRDRIGGPLGMDPLRAAWGIHEIVNENMATAARLHLLERGQDPRRFTLVAFGGAGPIHAHRVAAKLGISRILYPLAAGVASAIGLLAVPVAMDFVRTYPARLDEVDWSRVNALYAELVSGALQSGEAGDHLAFHRMADMRYSGQGYEIQVPLSDGPYRAETRAAIEAAFLEAYERIFGRRVTGVPLEVVSWRLFAQGAKPPVRRTADGRPRGTGPATKAGRPTFFAEADSLVDCPVYVRAALAPGMTLVGPAILEEPETSVVLGPGQRARVDEALNVVVEARPGEEGR
jgi:N-methylhydantoinase A